VRQPWPSFGRGGSVLVRSESQGGLIDGRIGGYVEAVSDERLGRRFKRWFWRPPRAHSEVIAGRTVTFLELFYDLVYVVVIAQAAHHLADHVSARRFAEFAVVFSLIWIGWVNGTLYLDLHGREDGRTRSIVFVQMGVLVLLAVFTVDAAGGDGRSFALTYAAFLVVLTWAWDAVRRQDRARHPEFLADTGRYVVGIAVSVVVILLSAFLPAGPRLVVWAGFACAWLVAMMLVARSGMGMARALSATHALVERFGLFTIIVLGEVVFGVVDGLSSPDRDGVAITTGMIALVIGFGFWWIYFDVVGRRLPRRDDAAVVSWMLSHLPITLSIAGSGAAMVSLIGHAGDARTPSSTAWLLSGAVALGLLALIVTARALDDAQRLTAVYQPVTWAMAGGAAAALVVGWTRPAPWLLALLLVAILSVLWFIAVKRFLGADAWG
jgi:low temperature requirement protein LtrA